MKATLLSACAVGLTAVLLTACGTTETVESTSTMTETTRTSGSLAYRAS